MIKQIVKYINKYHEANLWIAKRLLFEEKKQALCGSIEVQPEAPLVYEPMVNQSHVVFTQHDTGHNEEEKNRIQQLYLELGNLFNPRRLAV